MRASTTIPIISAILRGVLLSAILATNNQINPKERSTIVLNFRERPKITPPLHTISPKIESAIVTTTMSNAMRVNGFDENIDFSIE